MMSNCNSPMVHRASPFREESVDRGDAYKLERDLVIGELTTRMKGSLTPRLPPRNDSNATRAGFDKNRRGESDFDDFDIPTFGSSASFSVAQQDPRPSPSPVLARKFHDTDLSRSSGHDSKVRVADEVVSSASITPQRTSVASIKLAPSPKVTRRNRSKSPTASRMSRMAHSSSAQAHLCNGGHGNGMSNGHGSSSSSSFRANSSSRSGAHPSRHSPQRSISLQPPSRSNGTTVGPSAKGAAARKPLTINSTSSSRSSSRNGSRNGLNTISLSNNNNNNNSLKGSHSTPSFNRSISANPNLNDPAIAARIGNRAVKTVTTQRSIGKCGSCSKPITEDGCTAFGKVYHKECFKCTVCKQKIQGKFFERDGKPMCQKDFMKKADQCTACKQPIKGDSVESNNKLFHPECMRCYVCDVSLRGQYFTFQDKPICEMHYKQNADKCSVCGEIPMSKYYSINNQIYCEGCHVESCEKCPKCKEEVTGKVVRITGAAYHPDCFTCVVCKRNMINIPFVSDDKQMIFCPDDYNRKRAPKCSYCKKPIVPKEGQKTAPRLRALDRDFHPQCFKCEDCGLALDSRVKGKECYPFKNHILCIKCNRKKLSSSESDDDDTSGEEYVEE